MHREELLRYHPIRYYSSRPFFKPLFARYKKLELREGTPSLEGFAELSQRFASEFWNEELHRFPVETRPADVNQFEGELSLFWHVARWTEYGRNIFHFSSVLTTLLRLTDVDEVIWESIRFPHSSFYLWFGPQQQWPLLTSDHLIDGAYVSEARLGGERLVEILLTTWCQTADYANPPSFVIYRDVYYYFPFEIRPPIATVKQAFDSTLEQNESFDSEWTAPQLDSDLRAEMRELGVEVIQPEEPAQRRHARENIRGLPVFREVLKLVVNCLCYLGSKHREITTRYAEPQAEKSLEQAQTPRDLWRIQKKLARSGYTRIKFCGESLDREYESLPTGRELSAHWRRGHWRNQAFGRDYTQHKLIWIRPTLVRKDKADENLPGHVYDVTE